MLFNFKKEDDIFEKNEELNVIPEFCDLTDRQMKYVILSTDYKSPFRQLPERDRKEKAALQAGYKYEHQYNRLDKNGRNTIDGKVPSVEKAVEKYRSLQFDFDRDLLIGLEAQIKANIDLMKKASKTPQEMKLANEYITKYMVDLAKQRKELLKILELDEETISEPTDDSNGKRKKSRIDKRNEAIAKNA